MKNKSISKQIIRQNIKRIHRSNSVSYPVQTKHSSSEVEVELNKTGQSPDRTARRMAALESSIGSIEEVLISLKDKLRSIERGI